MVGSHATSHARYHRWMLCGIIASAMAIFIVLALIGGLPVTDQLPPWGGTLLIWVARTASCVGLWLLTIAALRSKAVLTAAFSAALAWAALVVPMTFLIMLPSSRSEEVAHWIEQTKRMQVLRSPLEAYAKAHGGLYPPQGLNQLVEEGLLQPTALDAYRILEVTAPTETDAEAYSDLRSPEVIYVAGRRSVVGGEGSLVLVIDGVRVHDSEYAVLVYNNHIAHFVKRPGEHGPK